MRALITILDGITETSMPFNEFVLYRATHYSDEQQVLIVCNKEQSLPQVDIPTNLRIIYVGRNTVKIRKAILSIIKEFDKDSIPYSIHLHQVQSGFLSLLAMAGTGLRKKTLFTVHSTFSGYKAHNKFLSFFDALFASRISCVSKTSYDEYPLVIKRIKKDRICVIRNGVDTERIDSVVNDSVIPTRDRVTFIYAARLIPIKNHRFLVDVLRECSSKIFFVFAGEEDADRTVRKYARDCGVEDRIEFTGFIPRNDVFARLKEVDCYISSSTLEGLPVSVLEAMYSGLPCILSDIPQHRETAGDVCVLLPFETDKWVEQITRIADMTPDDRKRESAQMRYYVEKNYTLRKMHDQYDTIYKLLR